MPNTIQVQVGALITADLFNELLSRLAAAEATLLTLSPTPTTGTIIVPSVFGLTLANARTVLLNPILQLNVGGVLDTAGNTVNPALPQSSNLLVLSQMPQAGSRVAPNTSVNLLVAGTGSTTPTPAPLPTLNAINSPVRVNGEAVITGNNFATLFSQNTVLFDGAAGTVLPSSNIQVLRVTVPSTIPGGPSLPGQPSHPGVQVTVSTPAGAAPTSLTCTVDAPLANQVTISSTVPAPPSAAVVGNTLTINGTQFLAGLNAVAIDGVNAPIVSENATTIVVTVPLISGLSTIPSSRSNVTLVVSVTGNGSASTNIDVARLF